MPTSSPAFPVRRKLRRLLALPFVLWMGLAVALRLPGPPVLTGLLGVLVALGALALPFAFRGARGALLFLGAFLLVLGGFLGLRPSNHRDWMPDVAQVPDGVLEGERLTLHHVRNCEYRSETDYDVHFEDRTYDLNQLQALDLFIVTWGPRHIAHTILSFDFGAGNHLAFSIETRKERHESYSALRGFFREYELCVVAGDERDLIRLRTNQRKEEVRLFRLNTPPAVARVILREYVGRINGLAAVPEWYNALTDNCTTAMLGPIRQHSTRLPWSWKLVASGHLDEYLYDRGLVARNLPLAQLEQAVLVNGRAQLADRDPAFSTRIREALPPR